MTASPSQVQMELGIRYAWLQVYLMTCFRCLGPFVQRSGWRSGQPASKARPTRPATEFSGCLHTNFVRVISIQTLCIVQLSPGNFQGVVHHAISRSGQPALPHSAISQIKAGITRQLLEITWQVRYALDRDEDSQLELGIVRLVNSKLSAF